MKQFFILAVIAVIFLVNCLGQENKTNEIVKEELVEKTLSVDWQHYATNNVYINGMIQRKHYIEAQITILQNQRLQFIAKDQYKTYTNTPYRITEGGNERVYSSKEAYDNEIIGGLIQSSLSVNDEIVRQKNLYFAGHASNVISLVPTNLTSPVDLKVTNN